MARKLLIIEPSITVQKVFSTTLRKSDYSIEFIQNSREGLDQVFEFQPDVVLVNAELPSPGGFEIVRLIRSFSCFAYLPVGMYATSPIAFDQQLSTQAGASSFIYLDPATLELNVEELAQLPSGGSIDRALLIEAKRDYSDELLLKKSTSLWKSDNFHHVILSRLYSMMSSWTSLEEVAARFLSLTAELCEVPMAAIVLLEHDGPHAYYIAASTLSEAEVNDFFAVCCADFEKQFADVNSSHILQKHLDSQTDLQRFTPENGVTLSSYECASLKGSDKKPFGTIHMVRSGNFIDSQLEALQACCENGSLLFENALFLKRKIFYEQRIRKAFSRFVPEQIIDDLANNNTQEKVSVGEKREIAILFSDIRSFTNISERNKPETIVAFLNRYFTVMVDIIKKHGGTIDKFIGDAIMALFGTPVSYEDNCRRAVAAAYEMRQALPDVPLEDLVMPEGMTFNIGIGIHYGDVIVGSIGSKDKTDYSVIGDSVNLASRLEGLTKTYGTQVLVSDSVMNEIPKGEFVFRHLDDVKVKGKAIAVPIYAVDRSIDEFPPVYRDAYNKGIELYTQGVFRLAKDYFTQALAAVADDKASKLMISRCEEFIANPPDHWDGAIAFTTK